MDDTPGPTRTQMAWLVGLVLAFGLAAVGLPFLFGSPDRWEYQIVSPSDYELETELDRLGREGWEVVSARRASDGSTYSPNYSYEMILKRRRSTLAFLGSSSSPTVTSTRTVTEPVTPAPASAAQRDYEMLDRQGQNVFAFVSGRFAGDTSRIRMFGGNLCGSMRSCTVRFWSERPSGAFTLPLSSQHRTSQVAEFDRSSGTVTLLR